MYAGSAKDGRETEIVGHLRKHLRREAIRPALREIQEIRWGESLAETTAGMTEGEIDESIAEFGRRIRESGRYPPLVRILESGVDPDSPLTRDERFEFGVDCMLDGIATRLKL